MAPHLMTSIWGLVLVTKSLTDSRHVVGRDKTSLTDLTYDIEVPLPNLQLSAVANLSLFGDDLGEFAASQQHNESSMVADAPTPCHIAEGSVVVTYH